MDLRKKVIRALDKHVSFLYYAQARAVQSLIWDAIEPIIEELEAKDEEERGKTKQD